MTETAAPRPTEDTSSLRDRGGPFSTPEAPTTAAVREFVVRHLSESGAEGVTRRELSSAAAQALPGFRVDLDVVLDSLLLLKVAHEDDGRLLATDLTPRFLEGARLAAAG